MKVHVQYGNFKVKTLSQLAREWGVYSLDLYHYDLTFWVENDVTGFWDEKKAVVVALDKDKAEKLEKSAIPQYFRKNNIRAKHISVKYKH